MKNKKWLIIVIATILVLFIIAIITKYADTARVGTGHEPRYCVKVINNDGSKVTYWGLGYKVIRYIGVSPNEPYENNIGVKMGNWFMKYELPKSNNIEIKYEGQTVVITDIKDIRTIENILVNSKYDNEICNGINTHEINLNGEIYYIKKECKEIQRGNKQANITDEDLETINKIISAKIDKNEEKIEGDVFNAKIKKIQEYNGITTILIEGLETNDINHRGQFEFSIDDDTKILWIEPESLKSSYTELKASDLRKGQTVSITSTGHVLESYPGKLTKVSKIILLENEL